MSWVDDVTAAVRAGDADAAYSALVAGGVQNRTVRAVDVRRYAALMADDSITLDEFFTLIEAAVKAS